MLPVMISANYHSSARSAVSESPNSSARLVSQCPNSSARLVSQCSRVAQEAYLEIEYIRNVLSVSGTLKYADSGTA